ncbi:MAG: DUF385 domain-containing protein [SAR202 cluster bacterium]|jgi:deazaflavin-dependent oxidoreductase (nitroreductase family)|nr:nitroreductase family deazaflavin-dependent oxidoreductase [Chloroflexota bacterium]MQG56576.1 DUF385 domain-containing protein [SAR202 cluster bacterium]MQG68819.1 DUF385 domain-containing protein [SAR202 cluster bacterium]HAL47806.1 nitroreductase family deazaflavin-dependent oxidoreductase [Dehalococcoidia bacterium]|tara:strand:- start:493 stop:873 length:381 start_codon:yes stop_codon:yes gene_type:complete
MDERVAKALETDRTIDITTTGRTSGSARRKEIWFHNLDGRLYITGTPGPRDWYANMIANPGFTFHLKGSVQADIPATARPITDAAERRPAFELIHAKLDGERDIDDWMARSPLVEVELDADNAQVS